MTFLERYVHTGKIALNVAEWNAPSTVVDAAGGGCDVSVMVLIHGYGSNWHTWGRVTDKLSVEFKLFAIDLRGMGRSGRFGEGSERQVWADDVAAVIRKLADRPVLLVGHSLGGWVTAAVSAQHPELVSKAVLVEPYTGAHSEVRKRERIVRHEDREGRAELMRRAVTPDDLIPMVSERYAGAAEDSIQRITQMYFELDPVLEAGRTNPADDNDTFDDMFSAIECPTLIIQGNSEKGGIMSDEETDRVAGLIPNSRALRWPKIGHSPHIARNHDFIRAIKRYWAE